MVSEHDMGIEAIEIPEGVSKTPPKRKSLAASFEEFQNDPKAYSMQRGLTPNGLRNRVIMPTNVQVRRDDGTLVDEIVDILRKIDFSRNYRGRFGAKDQYRAKRATSLGYEYA